MDVAILLTCFNRRSETLSCLLGCYRQIDALSANENYHFTVCLLDGGSSDGTVEAVLEAYPQTVIYKDDGNVYWNQSMRKLWELASKEKEYDFYLWLYPKARLLDGALSSLLENSEFLRHKAIVVGTSKDENGSYSYGGRSKSNKIIEPDSTIPKPCYSFDGCFVLVPKLVFAALGNLDPAYQHSFGDHDYGVRAYQNDIPRVVCPGVLAICEKGSTSPKWKDQAYPLKKRYEFVLSPMGRPFSEQFHYDLRSTGLFKAVFHFISLNLSVLFPILKSR